MSAYQACFSVLCMCRVLGVSPSGYYAWRKRTPSRQAQRDRELGQQIAAIHRRSRGTYGCQYTSLAFGQRCQEAGVRPSMGSVGDCYDNALCESFFATLECELLERHRFPSPAEARLAVFEFIEGWYNPHRRHSSLGQISPVRFEERHGQGAAA